MISEKEWLALLPFVNQVCNRGADYTQISEGHIARMGNEDITIRLSRRGSLNLEPEEIPGGHEVPIAGGERTTARWKNVWPGDPDDT